MAVQKHYNMDEIDSKNADFNLIYGEKSNGKSYQLKHKKQIIKYLETGRRFILMRRWDTELTSGWIESYFSDIDIEKLTNGKYHSVIKYRHELYFTTITDDFKKKRGEKIGYAIALSLEQNFAGGSFLDCDDIIFEEFMSRSIYIANEPRKLMTFYSTVDRKRGTTKLWMCGNTVSRVCPYINDWGLGAVMRRQKQGDIDVITIENEENDVTVAVEYCRSSGGKTMAIGISKDAIDTGSWQTTPQPHLPKSKKCYKVQYRFGFQYQSFKFICEYLLDKEDKKLNCWFIYPTNRDFKNMIVFSDVIKISPLWQRNIYDVSFKKTNPRLANLFETFRENRIFYASDLCGTDFKQVIDFQIRR